MKKPWTLETIQQYIDNQVEENLSLDYKSAGALAGTNGKKREITKDVSAFANAAGGVIVYGIKEYDDPERKHLPEKIDPVDRTGFSKEQLEQVINNIRPKIEGVIIHPVSLGQSSTKVVYVVEIPQSTTAHQAADHRYYTRYNFQSVPMEDHQIRDVMNRAKHPQIDLALEFVADKDRVFKLEASASNTGDIYAHYVNVTICLPDVLFTPPSNSWHNNGCHKTGFSNSEGLAGYRPILPGTIHYFHHGKFALKPVSSIPLPSNEWVYSSINWTVNADNSPPKNGETSLQQIKGFYNFLGYFSHL